MTNGEMIERLKKFRIMIEGLSVNFNTPSEEVKADMKPDIEALTHAIELLEAEGEGRLTVMPCKVGDKLYRVFCGEIQELLVSNAMYETLFNRWKVLTIPYMCIYWKDELGKTVFLTEAEAAEKLK